MIYQPTQNFNPKFLFKNKHFNTAYRYYFGNYKVNYNRKRITTKDNDFLDLDFSTVNSDTVIIAIHGLEGSSNSSYIKSLTTISNHSHIDLIALNLRGCSGEPNKLLSSYHSGKSDDLFEVVRFIESNYHYKNIHIIGFSLGGNITLKFMGEFADKTQVKSAVSVSVPCSLKGSSEAMMTKGNRFYMNNFLKTLKEKSKEKIKKFPNSGLELNKILQSKNFKDFDDAFTAPTHGFKDAEDYWKKSSSKQYLKFIEKPTLLITALDDPFLNKDCYPSKIAKNSKHFHLLTTKYGGHVGFYQNFLKKNNNWLENEILSFIKSNN